MVVSVESNIKKIITILEYLNFKPRSPESSTAATLSTLGDLIISISIKGVVTDDDLKWIRDYCGDIKHFWITMPSWLRKALSRLNGSAKFNVADLNNVDNMKTRIREIENAYIGLAEPFIGVYQRVAA